jgi:hypothetical protein
VDAVRDLFAARVFGEGTVAGAIAFGLVLITGWRSKRQRLDWAGVGFAAAAYLTLAGLGPLHGTGGVPHTLLPGIVLLGVGGLAVRLFRLPHWTAVLLFAPGAYILAYHADLAPHPDPGWMQPLVLGAITIGGALTLDFDVVRERRSLGPLLFTITIFGIYSVVPDTEQIIALCGASLALVAYTVPTPIGSLGPEGVGAGMGLLMWAAAFDARGRPTALIGAVGCLGLLVAEPIARLIVRPKAVSPASRRVNYEQLILAGLFGGLQIVFTLYAARVAGLHHKPPIALALLVPALLLAVGLSTQLPPPTRPRRRRRRPEQTERATTDTSAPTKSP